MRPFAIAVLVALASPAAADEPIRIELAVGESRTPLGVMPRCDDLAVVAISPDGRGVTGARPGATLCSFDKSGGGGSRQVYRIVVVAPRPKPEPGAKGERSGGTDRK